jgi:integrase
MSMQRFKTNYPGVRFKEHPTRKHGIKPDRYFSIYYWLDKKKKEEGLGWASQGWTAQKAAKELFDLKHSHRIGEGPQTLKERRTNEQERRSEENRSALTFSTMFKKHYLPEQQYKKSFKTEEILYGTWIEPVIGNLPLKDISPIYLERIKKNLHDKGRAAATARYVLAVISQALNYAKKIGLYNGDNPIQKVKKPTGDNRRVRFLTHEEANILLKELKRRSLDLHDISLLSLFCGIRAGEIFALTWGDVDLNKRLLFLRDTKSGHNRYAYMTDQVKKMLESRQEGDNDELVFIDRNGVKIKDVSRTFDRAVEDIGLNAGITDPRQKLVFHSLRHTYASWLVQSGVDLYTVQKLLGHSSLRMTERYSHLGQNNLQNAVRIFEQSLSKPKKSKVQKIR